MRTLGKFLFSKFQKIDPEVQGGFVVVVAVVFFGFCLFVYFFFEHQQPLLYFLMAFVNMRCGKVLVEGVPAAGTGRPL